MDGPLTQTIIWMGVSLVAIAIGLVLSGMSISDLMHNTVSWWRVGAAAVMLLIGVVTAIKIP